MQTQTLSFADSFSGPQITVYGNPVSDISFSAKQAQATGLAKAEEISGFARIRAFKIGNAPCVTLPIPSLLLVYGPGEELASQECHLAPGEVRKWVYPLGTLVWALEPSRGNAEDILESLANRGVEGGLSFESPRYENGKLCVDVHIWARIEVLGVTAKFDERFPVCISVGEQCHTVWEIGFANLQICYRAPNQICGKLCVGKFGISKCWEQCVSIPIVDLAPAAHPCNCAGAKAAPSTATGCFDCDASVDATVRDRKVEVTLAGRGIRFDAPDWLSDGNTVTVKYHGCGCYCTKGGRAELHFNGQRVACYTVFGDCDC